MLEAIFYARFHTERGPSIIHQYPRNSVVASTSSLEESLFNFARISSYVIPPYELCNHPLSICTNGFRILGFPISLEDVKYDRNRFTFNVCFVLKETASAQIWSQIVSKTAGFFKAIEEEDGLLQAEEDLPDLKWAGDEDYPVDDVGIIVTMLQAIYEDLNTYGETCVRIDDHHVLNLALSLARPMPTKVRAWDVPLLIRSLPSTDEWTWDLTLQRIHLHIDGVNHVGRIALLSDVELKLVKKAVRELLYHDRATILDIFHFQAKYALKSDFCWFIQDAGMQDECARYVTTQDDGFNSAAIDGFAASESSQLEVHKQALIGLYRHLHSGISLQDFYLNHKAVLANIDIRRFIGFGVIKGFLGRIQKYAMVIESHHTPPRLSTSNGSTMSRFRTNEIIEKDLDRAWKKAAFSSGWANPPAEALTENRSDLRSVPESVEVDVQLEDKLRRYLDGSHCMDEICVALRLSEKEVIERLHSGRFGDVVLFSK